MAEGPPASPDVTMTAGVAEQQRQVGGAIAQPSRGCGVLEGAAEGVTHTDRTLLRDLESLVDPLARGDRKSPLRWTCKRTRHLAAALQALGHQVGDRTVTRLLQDPR